MALTYFYAEMFGIIIGIIGLAMLVNRSMMREALREMFESRAIVLITGMVTLLVGLVMVLTHNVWDAGLLASIVSLMGWLIVIKGAAFMLLPTSALRHFYAGETLPKIWLLMAVVALLIGIYLTWGGFAGTTLPY